MEYRQLGRSGLRVSTLTLGTMTFGGRGGFRAVGATDVVAARRHVDMCLDAGVNLIDTADIYSGGVSEEITGEVISGHRDSLLLSTKVRMSMGDGAERRGPVPPAHHRRLRGQPAPARHRPHRHLPRARVGRADQARGDPVRA
jgi:aryl-alcohol dehydrogenase-like predicted oxidoreductase